MMTRKMMMIGEMMMTFLFKKEEKPVKGKGKRKK